MTSDQLAGRPVDVLAYVDWVWDLQWREALRADPRVAWQDDLSFDQVAAAVGVPAPVIAPGDVVLNVDLAVALYWPARPPGPVGQERRPSVGRPVRGV